VTIGIIAALGFVVAYLGKRQLENKAEVADLERRIASLKKQLARVSRT
jgi:hypothetical protein